MNGVVYDARELLADVRRIVSETKEREREENAGQDPSVSKGGAGSD